MFALVQVYLLAIGHENCSIYGCWSRTSRPYTVLELVLLGSWVWFVYAHPLLCRSKVSHGLYWFPGHEMDKNDTEKGSAADIIYREEIPAQMRSRKTQTTQAKLIFGLLVWSRPLHSRSERGQFTVQSINCLHTSTRQPHFSSPFPFVWWRDDPTLLYYNAQNIE